MCRHAVLKDSLLAAASWILWESRVPYYHLCCTSPWQEKGYHWQLSSLSSFRKDIGIDDIYNYVHRHSSSDRHGSTFVLSAQKKKKKAHVRTQWELEKVTLPIYLKFSANKCIISSFHLYLVRHCCISSTRVHSARGRRGDTGWKLPHWSLGRKREAVYLVSFQQDTNEALWTVASLSEKQTGNLISCRDSL